MAERLGHAASLMFALYVTDIHPHPLWELLGRNAQAHGTFFGADEKGALLWKASGMMLEGCVLASTGKSSEAIEMLTAGSIGVSVNRRNYVYDLVLSYLTQPMRNSANSMTHGVASAKQ